MTPKAISRMSALRQIIHESLSGISNPLQRRVHVEGKSLSEKNHTHIQTGIQQRSTDPTEALSPKLKATREKLRGHPWAVFRAKTKHYLSAPFQSPYFQLLAVRGHVTHN
jgi:hypothetical protein